MQRKLIVSLILMTGLLALAGGGTALLIHTRDEPESVEVIRSPLRVDAVRVEPQTVTERLTGFGTARAHRYARLTAQLAGEIVELPDHLRPGASVSRGEILIRIDDREYRKLRDQARSELASDRAQLAQLDVEAANLDRLLETAGRELASAEWEYGAVSQLHERGDASRREFEQARLAVEQIRRVHQQLQNQKDLLPTRREQLEAAVGAREAQVALAELHIEQCAVAAPFDGIVDVRHMEVGERVQPGTRLLDLLDPSQIEVPIELPVSVRDRVRVGAACALTLDASRDKIWNGQVARIAPSASDASRTFSVFVEVDNRDHAVALLPGVFVEASVAGATLENVLLLPRDLIRRQRVYVYNDGRAHHRPVQVERHLEEYSVVSGVSPGEIVITTHLDRVFDGAPVSTGEPAVIALDEPAPRPQAALRPDALP